MRAVDVPVIINDRADVAIAAGAAGVHLGIDDVPPRAIRVFAPEDFIIGVSVGSDTEVENSAGADYAGIGPVFHTGTKHDAGRPIGVAEFSRLAVATGLPAVAIGGITALNANIVMEAGAAGVAAVSAIFGANDPRSAAAVLASSIGS